MADPQMKQIFLGDIGINNSHHVQIGISTTDSGGSNIPEISKANLAIDNLRHRLLDDQSFRECLLNMKKTVVLEGTPGVGKTTAILAVVDELKQIKRQQDYDQKHHPDQHASQTPPGSSETLSGYIKEIAYCLCSAATRLVKACLLRRLIALVLDLMSSPLPIQQQIPKKRLESISSLVPAAVLFSVEKKDEQTSAKTLRFLLNQLVQQIPDAISHIRELKRTFDETGTEPSESDLEDTIAIAIKGHRACLFLDALDECSVDFLEELLPRIKRIQDQTGIGIVFTDRTNQSKQTWKQYFPSAINIPMWAENGDINAYIEMRLTKMANRTECADHWLHDETSRAAVKSAIVRASGRRFILACLNVDYILGSHGKTALTKDLDVVRNMGCDAQSSENQYHKEVLTKAYRRNVDRVLEQDLPWRQRRYPILVLGYMRDACRPLTIIELCYSVRMDIGGNVPVADDVPTSEQIRNICQGLVDLRDSGSVRFLHTTFKEYLASQEGLRQVPNQDTQLGRSCVTYLSKIKDLTGTCTNKSDLTRRLKQNPFLGYCARYWYKHLARSYKMKTVDLGRQDQDKTNEVYSASLKAALDFLICPSRVEASFQIAMLPDPILQKALRGYLTSSKFSIAAISIAVKPRRGLDPYQPNGTTGLHLVCNHGLETLFDGLIRDMVPRVLEAKDHRGRTPLHYAAESGHLGLVQRLVDLGADGTIRDDLGEIPLQLAIQNKRNPVAMWFLDKKGSTDVNNQTQYDHITGINSIEIIQTNVSGRRWTQGAYSAVSGRSPLHDTVKAENLELVQRILATTDAVVDSMDSQGMTPLHKASKIGNLAILKELVAGGAKIYRKIGMTLDNQPDSERAQEHHHYQGTGLHLACKYGHTEVVKYFLQEAPDLANVANARGEVPLHMAAIAPNAGVARLILMHCTDVNVQDEQGDTPLHFAALRGSFETVGFLIECDGIDLNVRNKMLRTPLFVSIGCLNPENFYVLWKRTDAHRDDQDKFGKSMYEYALQSRFWDKRHRSGIVETLSWTQVATGTYWEKPGEY